MSRRLQNVFVVCAMILAFVAWVLVITFRIMPCASSVEEAGFEEAYITMWTLTHIVSWIVGAVIGRVGYKLLAQINGWNSED